jgi:hypothetical protein
MNLDLFALLPKYSYQWVYAKLLCTSFSEMISDFKGLPPDLAEDKNLKRLLNAILASMDVIAADPYQLAAQCAGRLLPPRGSSDTLEGYCAVFLEGSRLFGSLNELAM